MSRLHALAVAGIVLCSAADAAPPPILETSAGVICRVHDKASADRWQPAPAQIAQLERLLPDYFAHLPEVSAQVSAQVPAPGLRYARQYSGIVSEGRRLIHGRFYPASDPSPSFAKPGDCWVSLDGGRSHWDVYFDPKSGHIVGLVVSGAS